MATYWKSTPRKMCEYCHCWITDNKPSVDFHERGKKHQENVKKKLDMLRKKGVKDALSQQTMESDLAAIEKAAMEALKKDISSDPSLASQYGLNIDATKPVLIREKSDEPQPDSSAEDAASKGEWYEAKSPEGYTYYWHTITAESCWEAPEKYISLEEQEKAANETEQNDDKDDEHEESISLPQRPSAYGRWQTVREERLPELNLPNAPQYHEPVEEKIRETTVEPTVPEPELEPETEIVSICDIPLPSDITAPVEKTKTEDIKPEKEPRKLFKEKRVILTGSQSSGGSVGFKKRKLNSGKRSLRQKTDD